MSEAELRTYYADLARRLSEIHKATGWLPAHMRRGT
jgi:hypothetical protein